MEQLGLGENVVVEVTRAGGNVNYLNWILVFIVIVAVYFLADKMLKNKKGGYKVANLNLTVPSMFKSIANAFIWSIVFIVVGVILTGSPVFSWLLGLFIFYSELRLRSLIQGKTMEV